MRSLASTAEPISAELLRSVAGELATFPADRIVVIGHERGERDYRKDGDLPARARERFGLPVDVGTVSRA